jgi:hypothetical protein
MKKITFSFNVLAAVITVAILQACASVGGLTQCATPTLTPENASGAPGSTIMVTISTTTIGANLCYTIDGSTPIDGSSGHGKIISAQSGTIPVRFPDVFGRTLKLQAIAFKPGLTDSPIATGYYTASASHKK